MLTTTTDSEERITTAHRAKLAYVYIRQSRPARFDSTRKARNFNIGWSVARRRWAGRTTGLKSSTTILENRAPRATRVTDFNASSLRSA